MVWPFASREVVCWRFSCDWGSTTCSSLVSPLTLPSPAHFPFPGQPPLSSTSFLHWLQHLQTTAFNSEVSFWNNWVTLTQLICGRPPLWYREVEHHIMGWNMKERKQNCHIKWPWSVQLVGINPKLSPLVFGMTDNACEWRHNFPFKDKFMISFFMGFSWSSVKP